MQLATRPDMRLASRSGGYADGVQHHRGAASEPPVSGANPFNLRVEQDQHGTWCVVRNVDGRRHVISRHPDEAHARAAADSINDASRDNIDADADADADDVPRP